MGVVQGRGAGAAAERKPETAHETIRRLNEIREEEARRIARELHDESAQMLAAVHLALDEVAQELPLLQRAKLAKVACLLEEAQQRLRHLSHELAPVLLADLGLKEALRYLACGFMDRYGVPIRLRYRLEAPLDSALETAVYRVVQEAVGNACRHARASRIQVSVGRRGGLLRVSVADDGRGFEAAEAERGLGLRGIRERAESVGGTARITSSPGKGTVVLVEAPLGGAAPKKKPAAALPERQVNHVHTHRAGG
jgi:signal transduction histidine kinase